MNALEGAAFIVGSLVILFTSVAGALLFAICAWTGAQVFIGQLKTVEEADTIVAAEAKKLAELEQMAQQ